VVYHTTCLFAKSGAEAAAFTAVHYTVAAVIPSSQHLSTRAGAESIQMIYRTLTKNHFKFVGGAQRTKRHQETKAKKQSQTDTHLSAVSGSCLCTDSP
jgi:hypothetical protein